MFHTCSFKDELREKSFSPGRDKREAEGAVCRADTSDWAADSGGRSKDLEAHWDAAKHENAVPGPS